MASKSSIVDIGHISGRISEIKGINGQISGIGQLKAKMSNATGGSYYPTYDGPYVVVPDAHYDQTLYTNNKVMKDNVTVTKVPFHETHNESGTTVYIAMEVQNG